MRFVSVVTLIAALAWGGTAAGQEQPPLCANDHLDHLDAGPVSVAQAVFEDEVDLSGAPAVIDILFVYTEWTAKEYGSGFRETVERMVEHASVMMLNSGGNVRLRLVGLEPAPAYLEEVEEEQAEGFGLAFKVLDWLVGYPSAPCCEAAELRDRYGADLLYGLVLERSWIACGGAGHFGRPHAHAAWINSAPGCMKARVLAHEVGHNLGLVHDERTTTAEPTWPGGRGFWSFDPLVNSDYGTIMSFSPHKEWRFSTSRSTHNGRVIGLPGEHEASDGLRQAAPYVAAYKRSKQREEPRYPCAETEDSDCMADGRFTVRASYRHPGAAGSERARIRDVYLGDTATLFYFFSADNPELLVKVLDGCALNGHYWVFGSAATDREYEVTIADAVGGGSRSYVRDASDPLISDIEAFRCEAGSMASSAPAAPASGGHGGRELVVATGGSGPPAAADLAGVGWAPDGSEESDALRLDVPSASGLPGSADADGEGYATCMDGRANACMEDGLFQVRVRFYLPPGQAGGAPNCGGGGSSWARCGAVRDSTIGDNAALFYFFTWDNPELLVKVLDGCAINGHYWVFGSAATDLRFELRVRDGRLRVRKEYSRTKWNPLISDVEAFPCAQ